jgi:RHS repeat-associated protein
VWIEECGSGHDVEVPYRFTGKEQDEETGLYYYGARYFDPKTSRWMSGDPAMGEYLPSAPISDEARQRNGKLPGQGGVFNLVNLHVYHYAGNNPVKYTDPDGKYAGVKLHFEKAKKLRADLAPLSRPHPGISSGFDLETEVKKAADLTFNSEYFRNYEMSTISREHGYISAAERNKYFEDEHNRYEALAGLQEQGMDVDAVMKEAKSKYDQVLRTTPTSERLENGRVVQIPESKRKQIADDAANEIIDNFIKTHFPIE